MNSKIAILSSLLVPMTLQGSISIVYNLRIAETTKRHLAEKQLEYPRIVTATLFDQFRERKDGNKQMIGGALGTFAYAGKYFYIKGDFAGAHARQTTDDSCFVRNQTDDFLITAGYNYEIHKRIGFTFSGLLGIPTHKDDSLEGIQFGYAHVGLGGQVDGDFIYSPTLHHSIRMAARLIHFFPRRAGLVVDTNRESFDVHLGNLADLFISHHSIFGKHSCELGYDFTSFFNAKIYPQRTEFVARTNYLRSSFFGTYKYRFLVRKLPNVLTWALSYGFDHTHKLVGNKYVVTLWGSWSMSF